MKRTRAPFLGEDVNFFPMGDPGGVPTIAKVVGISEHNPMIVRLHFYGQVPDHRKFIHHTNDEILDRYPHYRDEGCWDWNPQSASLFDLLVEREPAADKPKRQARELTPA